MAPQPAVDAGSAPLVVENAVKKFGDVRALDGASLTVGRGELVGLLGPNGAGKTTMLKAIAGRVALDSGTIRLFGRTLTRSDPRPELGIVPQELALYDRLTAAENLNVFGRLYGVEGKDLDARVDWALEWSDLKDRSREPVKRFSGGMKRRLNIAIGLMHTPQIVLLDEPTVGVDPQSRERIYEMLDALRSTGISIVLTTHHLEEAERRCERIVIIDHGRIVAAGRLDELVARAGGDGGRALVVTFPSAVPEGAVLPDGATLDEDRRHLRVRLSNVARDLPGALSAAEALGGTIDDVSLSGTTLQDVFIALTGRELRE